MTIRQFEFNMKAWIFLFAAIFGRASSSDFPPLPIPDRGCDHFCHSNLTKTLLPVRNLFCLKTNYSTMWKYSWKAFGTSGEFKVEFLKLFVFSILVLTSYAVPNLYSTGAKCITFNFTRINETASSYLINDIRMR